MFGRVGRGMKEGAIIEERVPLRVCKKYGTGVMGVRDAELLGALYCLTRVPAAGGKPHVMDAQSEWHKVQGMAAKTAREMGKGSNRPLEERVRRCVERHGRQRVGDELEEWQVVKDWGSSLTRVADRGVGVKPLIWVASHQAEGQAKEPCEFVVSLNEAADKAADEAMQMRLDMEPALEDVKVPAGIS